MLRIYNSILWSTIVVVFITKLLSSVWHAILDNFRPVAVWAADLALFYWFFNIPVQVYHRLF
jgi:hypothetical protein